LRCERRPPPGWPGEPCTKKAAFDVVYQLKTEELPRGIRLCFEHLEELRQLQVKGVLKGWNVESV
jgi:hypothetical protein